MKRVLKNKLTVISDEIKKITKSILAYCEISSKIEVVSHDCLFFNNLGEGRSEKRLQGVLSQYGGWQKKD